MKKLITTIALLSLASFAFNAQATMDLAKNNSQLDLEINSNVDIYGLQFDLRYDASEIKLSEDNINHMFQNGDSRSNMSVYSKIKEPGLARVIMFDISGSPLSFANNTEKVVSIGFDKESNSTMSTVSVTVENVVLAGLHGQSIDVSDMQTFEFSMSDNLHPIETKIIGNYPNPFNPITTIEFDLSELNQGLVDISVYDLQGRKVANIFNGYLDAGYGHKFNWDAANLASGRYFAQISAPGFNDTINMTLIK